MDNLKDLRMVVRHFYDLQKLRIQMSNRIAKQAAPAELSDGAKDLLAAYVDRLQNGVKIDSRRIGGEHEVAGDLGRMIKGIPIWENWLKLQKGCGPTIAAVILTEVDIRRCETPSALWAFAGLNVVDGRAPRLHKGQKSKFNRGLRTKLVGVLGPNLLKAAMHDPERKWRTFYDDYKTRKQNTLVECCMLCEGSGWVKDGKPSAEGKGSRCDRCDGTGGPAKWGRSDAHVHTASIRYMVKMFLRELWVEWRKLEGLPITETYAEAYLGRRHGDHGGSGAAPVAAE